MRHRSRGAALALPTAALLLAVAGCSGGGVTASPTASRATGTASAPPTTPAAPTPSAPAPGPASPSAAPSAQCVDTGAMDPDKLTVYLGRLKSSSGSYGSRALKIDGSGLSFDPDPTERPCSAVKVTLSRFWVDITPAGRTPGLPARPSPPPGQSARPTPPQKFQYALMDRPVLTVGPAAGIVDGSVPPQSSACRGSLSVVHTGADISEADLPADLQMPTSYTEAGRGAMDVKLKSDRALAATFVPPSAPSGC
ncbi:hypothetical protein ABT084_20470 [Streptomyces sp. NPDC002138]|uniref:hypothetical protein n=1 Tax=Streptomyces sp. NPDC002138 TaxID=3154410 RepID=UPI0033268971